jgi:hypothetical protein
MAVPNATQDPFALLTSEHDEQRGLLSQLEALTVSAQRWEWKARRGAARQSGILNPSPPPLHR